MFGGEKKMSAVNQIEINLSPATKPANASNVLLCQVVNNKESLAQSLAKHLFQIFFVFIKRLVHSARY
jgi:hypothetical protein